MLTLQEIFDKSATHLLKQGAQALDADGFCVYKEADGNTCAVGCLIEPEHYDKQVEGNSVASIYTLLVAGFKLREPQQRLLDMLKDSGVPTGQESLSLLKDLQRVHDRGPASAWRGNLRTLAAVHKLSTQVLKN